MALIVYEKTLWVNGTAPAINATHLLNLENGVERVTNAVIALEASPYELQPASEATIGGVTVKVIDNGDGTFSGEIGIGT